MKIALILIVATFFMLPSQEVEANIGSIKSFNFANEQSVVAMSQSAKREYKVKNRQQAAQMVKEKYRAKVVSIQSEKVNGNAGYKAKLLGNDGVVFYVYIDASSGKMRRR